MMKLGMRLLVFLGTFLLAKSLLAYDEASDDQLRRMVSGDRAAADRAMQIVAPNQKSRLLFIALNNPSLEVKADAIKAMSTLTKDEARFDLLAALNHQATWSIKSRFVGEYGAIHSSFIHILQDSIRKAWGVDVSSVDLMDAARRDDLVKKLSATP